MDRQADSSWFSQPRGIAALWFGLLAGPVVWGLHLGISHFMVDWVCAGSARGGWFHGVTLIAVAVSVAGAIRAWHSHQRLGTETPDDSAGDVHDRSRFMTTGGMALSVFFTMVIVAQWLPTLLLDPCTQ